MSNLYRVKRSKSGAISCAFLLFFCFTGIASATLSGIEPGYPRFKADNTQVEYYQADGNTFYFDAYNTNSKVFWQETESMSEKRLRANPFFYTQVDIDTSNLETEGPQVLDGSFLEVWGILPGQRTSNTLLFTAEISKIFWDTDQKIVEFILDGGSQDGEVCNLGFCSFSDEVLQFTLRKFDGDWSKEFTTSASAIATVPLPAAAWLFSCAVFGLFGFQRRKDKA